MRTCPACSRALQDDSSFCSACGTPVGAGTEPPTEAFRPPDMALATGRVLAGHYRVGARLGKGGMGEVYGGRDEKLGREVALKVVRPDLAGDPVRLARLQREARLLAALNHPHLAQLYALEQDDGLHFLVMELVPGPTLASMLERSRLPVAEALRLARQIAEALETAHERGVIHRDLKPANVKVTPEGEVKVLDFGLAKSSADADPAPLSPDLESTREGVVLGTPAYMSPEQARGQPLDKRTDIWSFGCVLYEMLTGVRAFRGGTSSDVIAAVLERTPDWQALPADVPPPVRELVKRCLRKDVRQRVRDLGDVRIALEEALAAPPSAPAGGTRSWPRRHWPVAALGGLLLGLLVGFWLGNRRAAAPGGGDGTVLVSGPAPAAGPQWAGDFLLGGSTVALEPRVSPDGHRLAFITLVDGQGQVAVMDLRSSSARAFRVLTTKRGAGAAAGPTWSRDGTRLYFYRFYSVPLGVFTVRADEDRGEEQLVLADAASPEVLPDGDLVVDRAGPRGHQLYRLSLDRGSMDPIGGPIVLAGARGLPLSVFPDGKELVFIGRPADAAEGTFDYYIADIGSGATRRVGPVPGTEPRVYHAVRAADDRSFYAVERSGDLYQIVQISRSGDPSPRTVLTVPWVLAEIDVDQGGSVYVRHVRRPDELLRFPVRGGVPDRLLTGDLPLGGSPTATPRARLLPLPGGRVLMPSSGWGTRVELAEPGKRPRDFVQTNRATGFPAAALGTDRVALMHGTGADRTIAVVTLHDGRIVRRVADTPPGRVSVLAGSADGRVLYFVEGGQVWRLPLTDPKARPEKLCPGARVAPEPNSPDVIVLRREKGGFTLVRVSGQGEEEKRIPFHSADLRLNPQAITDGCVAADGRILVGVASADSWYYSPAVLDPKTGKVEKIPVEYDGDIGLARWGEDGQVIANGLPVKTELWRFRRVAER